MILTAITVIFAALTLAQQGWTQSPPSIGSGRDMNREKAIWQELEKVVPKSVETFKAATEAFDKQDYEDSRVHTRAQTWRYLYYSLYLVGAWVVGLALLFTLGKLFSNFTLRSIEEADPNGATSAKEISLRSRYKRLINVAGVYYYISLPVVIFLVLLVAGSIFYGFYMIGRIPVKLAAIVAIAAAVTIYKMIRSLFVKIASEDPGRALKPEEAPGLWELTREVAQAVSTRPIDEIRVTPGCDLAVYKKGGFREKMQDRAKRILILGVGALNGMRQNAFRAVLAHEYGHFSHRDTAGGDVALRVDREPRKTSLACFI
jgi:Zn-dependent protease with chaperone function